MTKREQFTMAAMIAIGKDFDTYSRAAIAVDYADKVLDHLEATRPPEPAPSPQVRDLLAECHDYLCGRDAGPIEEKEGARVRKLMARLEAILGEES